MNEISITNGDIKWKDKNNLIATNGTSKSRCDVMPMNRTLTAGKLTSQSSESLKIRNSNGSSKLLHDAMLKNGALSTGKLTNGSSGSLKIANGSPKPWRDAMARNGVVVTGKLINESPVTNGSTKLWRDSMPGNGAAVGGKLTSLRSMSDLRMADKRSLHRAVLLLKNTQSVRSLPGQDVIDAKVMSRDPNTCSCCGGGLEYAESNEDEAPGMSLSWRRLYISRAKLQAAGTASELLFGFAMIGLVELQINRPTHVPEAMFILFSVNTSFLVIFHIFALMISTFILPNIDTVKSLHPRALIEESPHYRMRWFIDIAWVFSTMLGMFLFLFEVVLFAWFKFWDYSFSASVASTVVLTLSISIFIIFALYFYHTIHVYVYDYNDIVIKDLELANRRQSRK